MDARRSLRVAEAIREELSELIGFEVSDPKVAGVVVSSVILTPDMRNAQVRVLLGEGAEEHEALAALEHARHFLRRQLASRITTFRSPELHFEVDQGAASTNQVERLLKRAEKWRAKIKEPSGEAP